jgi:F-type H+-transporting ATPase subunit b
MLASVRTRLVILATTALPAAAAFAQPHEGEGAHKAVEAIPSPHEGLFTGITAVVVFIVVLAILGAKVWPTISKGLDERADKIKSEIEAAEQARVRAKQALEEYEKSLGEARNEAQKMIEQARAAQTAQLAEMKARSDAEIASAKSKMLADIEAAKKQALADIYTQGTALATSIAGNILKREVTAGDQSRFVEEAISGLSARH